MDMPQGQPATMVSQDNAMNNDERMPRSSEDSVVINK